MDLIFNCPKCGKDTQGMHLYGTYVYRLFCKHCEIAVQDISHSDFTLLTDEEKDELMSKEFAPSRVSTEISQDVTQEKDEIKFLHRTIMAAEQPVAEESISD